MIFIDLFCRFHYIMMDQERCWIIEFQTREVQPG